MWSATSTRFCPSFSRHSPPADRVAAGRRGLYADRVTALAVNLLALLIVLGLCWGAMMWLSGRFHGHGGATTTEVDGVGDLSRPAADDTPCTVCEGVGATSRRGKLEPCRQCYGTGVLS